jgi:hypothetical protein
MSTPLGKHQFFPWLRRGAAADIDPAKTEKPDGSADARVSIPVGISFTTKLHGTGVGAAPAGITAQLHGPGDVVGVDRRHVIRTDPVHLTPAFEPNYFAGMDFDHPEFPWLFTPAAAGGNELRPWVSLICLKAQEFTASTGTPNPLPTISVTDVRALPDLADSYAWAHTQAAGQVQPGGLADIIAHQPQRIMSRILCPRRLEPDTAYTAFLVPAYDIGVQAGLGKDTSAASTAKPAWDATTTPPVMLPFYHSFEFHTGSGDFESLVRQLKPRELGQLGYRPLDVDHAGWGLPSAGQALDFGGALRSVGARPGDWTGPAAQAYQQALTDLVNVASPPTADGPDDPVIAPPVYAHWQAAHPMVDEGAPVWLRSLNDDPRNRAAAGLGSQVVQQQRSQLLASAWQQVPGILAANALLRRAQAARAALTQLHVVSLAPLTADTALAVTAPLHSTIKSGQQTVRAHLASGPVPVLATSAAFRRVTRPLGPIRRRQGATGRSPGSLLARFNNGQITAAPPSRPPDGMVSVDQVSDTLYPPGLPPVIWQLLARLRRLLLIAGVVLLLLAGQLAVLAALIGVLAVLLKMPALVFAAFGLIAGAVLVGVFGLLALALALLIGSQSPSLTAAGAVRTGQLTHAAVAAYPARPDFRVMPAGQPQPTADGSVTGPSDSADGTAFRGATSALAALVQAPLQRPVPPVPQPADLGGLSGAVLAAVNPAVTVPARIGSVILVGPFVQWPRPGADPLEEIMAAPVFPQPMYEPLRDLAKERILPGLETVPPNTMTILEPDHAFIEAYLAGANDEMARQLLWVDFPTTDLRATYFRQFWDVRAYVPRPGDPTDLTEALKDIPPIHLWPAGNDLGQNQNRTDLGSNIVLLLRGDLLFRYPDAVIYACEAVLGEGGRRTLGTAEVQPLYRGTLGPDLTYFGFPLTAAQAKGSPDPGQPQGYFIVFQQHPTEPRFGLEDTPAGPVTDWNDLSWLDFELPADPTVPFFVPARTPPHNVQSPLNVGDWGKDAARMAVITLRRPIRVAVHGSLLLPPGSG